MQLSKDRHFSCLAWLIQHLNLVLYLLKLRNLFGHVGSSTAITVGSMNMLATGCHCKSFLSAQWAFAWGMADSLSAWCCFHHARAGTAGMVSRLGRLQRSSPASCSCAATNTQQRGLSYLTTYILYSGPVVPSFSSTFSGWLLCVDIPYQETI